MKPLYDFRVELVNERNLLENRLATRRDGSQAINDMGSYQYGYRASILRRLLEVQHTLQKTDPKIVLVTDQELIAIQVNWYRDFNFEFRVSDIYNKVYNKTLDMKDQDDKFRLEAELLKEVCKDAPDDFELIQQLLILQKNKSLLKKRWGLKNDIERRIEEHVKNEK